MLENVISNIQFNRDGLVPAIIQSAETNRVLMLAWMNAQSLAISIESGETVFWSRSRQELWHKGETSGHVQQIVSIEADCDSDSLLIRVHEAGPACHNGTESCFDSHKLLDRP